MAVTNIHEAKTNLSKLVERAEQGEEIVIARAGKPVAKLVPYRAAPKRLRQGGQLKGKIRMAPDFDELPEDIAAAFGIATDEGDASS